MLKYLLGGSAVLIVLCLALELLIPGKQWGFRLMITVLALLSAFLLFQYGSFMVTSIFG